MILSPEFRLLCFSLRVDDKASAIAAAEKIIDSDNTDWEKLYNGAIFHGISPQVAEMLRVLKPDKIPAGFREKINAACRENLFRQLSHVSEFFRINRLLENAGIKAVPFKGFILADNLYGNIAARESVDVDLFVRGNDLEKVKELMIEDGYSVESSFASFSVNQIRKNFGEYNFDRFEGDKRIYHFEFHHGISLPVYGMNIRLEDLLSQTLRGEVQNNELWLFNPSASLLLTIMHHGGDDRFIKLQQIYDVALFLEKHGDIDWRWVICEASRFGLVKVVYTAARLAFLITGAKIPMELNAGAELSNVKRLTEDRVRMLSRPSDYWHTFGFNFSNWLFRVRSRTGFRLKLRMTFYSLKAIFKKSSDR